MYENAIDPLVQIVKFMSALMLLLYTALPAGLNEGQENYKTLRSTRLKIATWLLLLLLFAPLILCTAYILIDLLSKGYTAIIPSVAGYLIAGYCLLICVSLYYIGRDLDTVPEKTDRRFWKALLMTSPIDMTPEEIFTGRMIIGAVLILTFSADLIKALVKLIAD